MESTLFTKKEKMFLIAVGLVMGFRELSMTMINPFINIYGKQLLFHTPFLCGLGLGIYGLLNAIFQIPYGLWSDRVGRKKVILVGLAQLSIGLFIAFFCKNIYTFIFARALQGSGAVMAIAYSWIGDNIEDEKKDRAIGISGTIVGIGAVGAFGVGPALYKLLSIPFMFLGCGILIFFTAIFILLLIPENIHADEVKIREKDKILSIYKENLKRVIKDRKILQLSLCGFIINYIMATTFMIVPEILQEQIGGTELMESIFSSGFNWNLFYEMEYRNNG